MYPTSGVYPTRVTNITSLDHTRDPGDNATTTGWHSLDSYPPSPTDTDGHHVETCHQYWNRHDVYPTSGVYPTHVTNSTPLDHTRDPDDNATTTGWHSQGSFPPSPTDTDGQASVPGPVCFGSGCSIGSCYYCDGRYDPGPEDPPLPLRKVARSVDEANFDDASVEEDCKLNSSSKFNLNSSPKAVDAGAVVRCQCWLHGGLLRHGQCCAICGFVYLSDPPVPGPSVGIDPKHDLMPCSSILPGNEAMRSRLYNSYFAAGVSANSHSPFDDPPYVPVHADLQSTQSTFSDTGQCMLQLSGDRHSACVSIKRGSRPHGIPEVGCTCNFQQLQVCIICSQKRLGYPFGAWDSIISQRRLEQGMDSHDYAYHLPTWVAGYFLHKKCSHDSVTQNCDSCAALHSPFCTRNLMQHLQSCGLEQIPFDIIPTMDTYGITAYDNLSEIGVACPNVSVDAVFDPWINDMEAPNGGNDDWIPDFGDQYVPGVTDRQGDASVVHNDPAEAIELALGLTAASTPLQSAVGTGYPAPDKDFCPARRWHGAFEGYVFKKGTHGLGYYRTPDKVVLKLCDLLPPPAHDDTAFDGECLHRCKRVRAVRNARRKRFFDWVHTVQPTLGASEFVLHLPQVPGNLNEIQCGSHFEAGLFAIDTANTNAYSTARDKVLNRTSADIVCLQEHKLDKAQLANVTSSALQKFWRMAASPAKCIEKDGLTGGCMVASTNGIGITGHCADAIEPGHKWCTAAAHAACLCRGGVHIISGWLHHSQGLSAENTELLEEWECFIRTIRGPWIIAADWNMAPATLAKSQWIKRINGVIVAPACPTCNGSTFDYFVVARKIVHAVVAVIRIDDGGFHPHHPVRMLLRPDARRKMVRTLVKPSRVKACIPHGPLAEKNIQQDMLSEGELTKERLDRAMVTWYKQAYDVFWSLDPLPAPRPDAASYTCVFKLKATCGNKASPISGHNRDAALWTNCHNRAMAIYYAAAAVEATGCSSDHATRLIIANANDVLRWHYKSKHGLPAGMHQWAVALATKYLNKDMQQVRSLAKIAQTSASIASARHRKETRQRWCDSLVKITGSAGEKHTPTAASYRRLRCKPISVDAIVHDNPEIYDDLGEHNTSLVAAPPNQWSPCYQRAPLSDQGMVVYESGKWFALWETEGKYEEIWPTDMPVCPH